MWQVPATRDGALVCAPTRNPSLSLALLALQVGGRGATCITHPQQPRNAKHKCGRGYTKRPSDTLQDCQAPGDLTLHDGPQAIAAAFEAPKHLTRDNFGTDRNDPERDRRGCLVWHVCSCNGDEVRREFKVLCLFVSPCFLVSASVRQFVKR